MRLLVADDDVMFHHQVAQTVSSTSLEVTFVKDGAQAWQLLSGESPPRLVLLDWMMPELDGLDVCRKVRGLKSPDYTYIMLVTGRHNKSDVLTALEAGVDDYITKPVNREELLGRVQIGRRFVEKENRLSAIIRGWRTMIDSLPFGVACLGRRGELLRANVKFANQLGKSVKEILFTDLMPGSIRRTQDIIRLRDSIKRAIAFDMVDMEIFPKAGPPQRVLVWGRPMSDAGDLVYQITVTPE